MLGDGEDTETEFFHGLGVWIPYRYTFQRS